MASDGNFIGTHKTEELKIVTPIKWTRDKVCVPENYFRILEDGRIKDFTEGHCLTPVGKLLYTHGLTLTPGFHMIVTVGDASATVPDHMEAITYEKMFSFNTTVPDVPPSLSRRRVADCYDHMETRLKVSGT